MKHDKCDDKAMLVNNNLGIMYMPDTTMDSWFQYVFKLDTLHHMHAYFGTHTLTSIPSFYIRYQMLKASWGEPD